MNQILTHKPAALITAAFGAVSVDAARRGIDLVRLGAALGVEEAAMRTALRRMVESGALVRAAAGRQALFAPTALLRSELDEGAVLAAAGLIAPEDAGWTVVVIRERLEDRAQVRARRRVLERARFGEVRPGMWVGTASAGDHSLRERLLRFGEVLVAPAAPLLPDAAALAAVVFDLSAARQRLEAFIERWKDGGPVSEPAAAAVLLHLEWLLLVRGDPYLPRHALPADWPAGCAIRVYTAARKRCAGVGVDPGGAVTALARGGTDDAGVQE